jgi:hypothetical protein
VIRPPSLSRVALLVLGLSACGRTELGVDRQDLATSEPEETCRDGVVPARPAVSNVLFLVDRSGSMAFDMEGRFGTLFEPLKTPTRWSVLRRSLQTVLPKVEDRLAVGLAFFPSDDSCGADVALAVPPAPGNASSVLSAFGRGPGGGTPTTRALESGAALAKASKASVMVLVTDGEPNCNDAEDPRTCQCTAPRLGLPPVCNAATNCSDATRAIATMGTLQSRFDVTTFVVGLGADSGNRRAVLQSLASAGGRLGPARRTRITPALTRSSWSRPSPTSRRAWPRARGRRRRARSSTCGSTACRCRPTGGAGRTKARGCFSSRPSGVPAPQAARRSPSRFGVPEPSRAH